jgi:hypothetical protein
MPPPSYHPLWLSLSATRAKLVAKEISDVDAEIQLRRAIKDAALPGEPGPGLKIRLNGNDNPHFLSHWLRYGRDWLLNPQLDFDRSEILIPQQRPEPPVNEIQRTLRQVAESLYKSPAPPIIDEIGVHLELWAEDIARLWSDPEPEREPPVKAEEPGNPQPASDDPRRVAIRAALRLGKAPGETDHGTGLPMRSPRTAACRGRPAGSA